MRKLVFLLVFLFIASASSTAQQRSFMSYYQMSDMMPVSPGAFKFGLYGYLNPAISSYTHDSDLLLVASEGRKNGNIGDFNKWGIFSGSPYSGFGAMTHRSDGHTATDYRFSAAFGNRKFSAGLGYGFIGGDKGFFGLSNIWYWGLLYRPVEFVSLGFHQTRSLEEGEFESVVDLGVRPIPGYPLTFFADYAMFQDQNFDDGQWSAGVSWEVVDGVRVSGRYFENERMSIGVDLSLGRQGVSSISQLDDQGEYGYNSYAVRFGAIDRSLMDVENIIPMDLYAKLDLSGKIAYRKPGFSLFMKQGKTVKFIDILKTIDIAKQNEMLNGIVINAQGISVNFEMAWEIRDKLREFKETGKEVIIFIDDASITTYHLASIADEIIIDELGMIMPSGYSMGRSYYKDLLEKAHIGFDEFRLFKYKSAVEGFSRDNMSEADREQRQKLIDDWFEIVKKEVAESRDFSEEDFEKIVNGELFYNADEAIENDLADRKGRWIDVEELLKKDEDDKIEFIPSKVFMAKKYPVDDQWGKPEYKIAVVYALGECAMETGIKARKLSKQLKKAIEDDEIHAIVLRVDSPGGSAMASDYIAKLIKENKDKKPIIVSQGAVAASGGYWISMYADTIVASPMTITGSIGVIAGWFYDKGLSDTLGISSEVVKRGKYSDLGFSWSLPFIGLGLPTRTFNEDERSQMENMIKDSYKMFVTKVASGRDMEYDEVEKIAQGRVWTGMEGKKIGLVDELGGLWKAIEIAKDQVGIKDEDNFEIVDPPSVDSFDFMNILSARPLGQKSEIDEFYKSIKFRIENNGKPMPIMSIDYYNLISE